MTMLPVALALLLLSLSAPAQDRSVPWNLPSAEHLLGRAGFGGAPEAVRQLEALGCQAAVQYLLGSTGRKDSWALPSFRPQLRGRLAPASLRSLPVDERRRAQQDWRRKDRKQLVLFRAWWLDRMVETPAPLEEKLVLFWHGYFTSSQRDVRDSYHMIVQNELFREQALGNFRVLLHQVSRDPAMLEYLDNNRNRKGKPNENFAREVMELFTLGVGNYTEQDIKEAARAFTGWTFRGNRFFFARGQHDRGEKTIQKRTGRFDGDDVLDILLDQPAAAQHLAARLVRFFAGPEAPTRLTDRLARLLRSEQWELKPVLAALFSDPDFYGPRVMGSHVQSPVEFVVGIARKLGEHPSGAFLAACASSLGQTLLMPPNVKGWEGEQAWLTTSSLLARGNLAGYLVSGMNPARIRRDYASPGGKGSAGQSVLRSLLRAAGQRSALRWQPMLRMSRLPEVRAARSAGDLVQGLCDRFLTLAPSPGARRALVTFVGQQTGGTLKRYRQPAEGILKRLVRLILSLPEAQLG